MASKKLILNDLIDPVVTALGYEYVGCEYHFGRGATVRIFIDTPKGVSVEDCETVSRQVGAVLDVGDPIPGGYTLEVSSPGLERPLFKLAQYQRFLGSRIKIRLQAPQEGRRNFSGVLQEVVDDTVVVQGEDGLFQLKYSNIEKAHLVYP